MVDTGASISVVPTSFLTQYKLPSNPYNICLRLANGKSEITSSAGVYKLSFGPAYHCLQQFVALKGQGNRLLLGRDWVVKNVNSIRVKNGRLEVFLAKGEIKDPTGSMKTDEYWIGHVEVDDVVKRFSDLFVADIHRLTPMKVPAHEIKTGTAGAVRTAPYRIKPAYRHEVTRQINEMLSAGIIEEAMSPYLSPVVVVEKKNGKLRLCVDFRKLNSITKRDEYLLPLPDDLFDVLGDARVFSKLDAFSGFWQVPLAPADKEKTAFGLRGGGTFQFNVMPFGLQNAPATFQRTMEMVLGPLLFVKAVVFVDDILVFSKNPRDHERDLEEVFQRLRQYNVSLNREKCDFGMNEVEYLGFVIGEGRLKPAESKVEAMLKIPMPASKKELQSLLGTFQYYRRFIPDFARLAVPMFHLLKKDVLWNWTENHSRAVELLKQRLSERTLLALPQFDAPFILTTDASKLGLSAILSQVQEGTEVPLSFLSRKTRPAEQNYSATDLEGLAVVWAVHKLNHYLTGHHFTLYTDHAALLGILQKGDQQVGRRGRWVSTLNGYDFEVRHRKGVENPADSLSRQFAEDGHTVAAINILSIRDVLSMTEEEFEAVKTKGRKKIRRNYQLLDNGQIWTTSFHTVGGGKALVEDITEIANFMQHIHDEGHLGRDNMIEIFQREKYGLNLKNIAVSVINHCERCRLYAREPRNNPLHQIDSKYPGHVLGIDVVGPLPSTARGNIFIITAIDLYTRWPFAKAYKTVTNTDVQDFFCTEILPIIGVPQQVISDRGTQFISEDTTQFLTSMGVRHTPSTAYHPQTNGACERLNATLQSSLKKLTAFSSAWDKLLWQVLMVIRQMKNHTTGKTPSEMLTGRTLKTPATFQMTSAQEENVVQRIPTIARAVRDSLAEIRRQADVTIAVRRANYERNYNVGVRPVAFSVGNTVLKLIANPRKFEHHFNGPYKVTRVLAKGAYVICDDAGRSDSVNGDKLILFETAQRQLQEMGITPIDSTISYYRYKSNTHRS